MTSNEVFVMTLPGLQPERSSVPRSTSYPS
jgi:hypothetical protein